MAAADEVPEEVPDEVEAAPTPAPASAKESAAPAEAEDPLRPPVIDVDVARPRPSRRRSTNVADVAQALRARRRSSAAGAPAVSPIKAPGSGGAKRSRSRARRASAFSPSASNGGFPCPMGCGRSLEPAKMGAHAAKSCPRRFVRCADCGAQVQAQQLGRHRERCSTSTPTSAETEAPATPAADAECAFCGQPVPGTQLSVHEEFLCDDRPRECRQAGCRAQVRPSRRAVHEAERCKPLLKARERADNAERARARRLSLPCPGCGEAMSSYALRPHQELRCPGRLIECINVVAGCAERVPVRDMGKHLATACAVSAKRADIAGDRDLTRALEAYACAECGEELARRAQAFHEQHECPQRPMTCNDCGETLPVADEHRHRDVDCQGPRAVAHRDMAKRARARARWSKAIGTIINPGLRRALGLGFYGELTKATKEEPVPVPRMRFNLGLFAGPEDRGMTVVADSSAAVASAADSADVSGADAVEEKAEEKGQEEKEEERPLTPAEQIAEAAAMLGEPERKQQAAD